jgi:hypothetical protein
MATLSGQKWAMRKMNAGRGDLPHKTHTPYPATPMMSNRATIKYFAHHGGKGWNLALVIVVD